MNILMYIYVQIAIMHMYIDKIKNICYNNIDE